MNSIASLIAGLMAQDWVETRTITPDWQRFGKFGRGAAYVICHDCRLKIEDRLTELKAGELWFGPLATLTPQVKVIGPILEQVLLAGGLRAALDSTELLVELLDYQIQNGGRENQNDKGGNHG